MEENNLSVVRDEALCPHTQPSHRESYVWSCTKAAGHTDVENQPEVRAHRMVRVQS